MTGSGGAVSDIGSDNHNIDYRRMNVTIHLYA